MEDAHSVLVVEDDKNLIDLLSLHLSDIGFRVDTSLNGTEGLEKAMTGTYDLIVLDLMLPGMSGYEICRELRDSGFQSPIIMLTARQDEFDKVHGF